MSYVDVSNSRIPGRWRTLTLLALTLILSMTTWFSASAVLPQLSEIWELSAGMAAWMTIAVQLGFVVGALISSLINLSDIFSPRHVILAGATGAAFANLLLFSASGFIEGLVLRFTTGFFLAGVFPPAFKLISTWFRENRGLAMVSLISLMVSEVSSGEW